MFPRLQLAVNILAAAVAIPVTMAAGSTHSPSCDWTFTTTVSHAHTCPGREPGRLFNEATAQLVPWKGEGTDPICKPDGALGIITFKNPQLDFVVRCSWDGQVMRWGTNLAAK